MRWKLLLAAPIMSLVFLPTEGNAQADVFLAIEGVEGESTAGGFEGQIDVESFSWTATNAMSAETARTSGKSTFFPLRIVKTVDAASTELTRVCATGKHFPSAKLTVRKSGGDHFEYYVIELDRVLVTSVSVAGARSDNRPLEEVELAYGRAKWTYTSQRPDGRPGRTSEFAWDVEQASPY